MSRLKTLNRKKVKNTAIKYHTHPDGKGSLIKCYHECKSVLTGVGFWAGVTISFPLEHFIWERVFPFYKITQWLGL